MKKNDIHELCSRLCAGAADSLEPVNDTKLRPSAERIKTLAMAKLSRQQGGEIAPERRRIDMKRMHLRVLAAAIVVVCLVSISVVAAMGGLEYFRSIFGGSADAVEERIEQPMISAENENFRLRVEASLTDGYKSNVILSVEAVGSRKLPDFSEKAERLFAVNIAGGMSYCVVEPMEAFSEQRKAFVRVEVATQQSHVNEGITIAMQDALGAGSLTLQPKQRLAMREIQPDAAQFDGQNYRVETVQISPLGALVIGSEQETKGSLPNEVISIVMKDGSVEEIMPSWAFDQSDDETTVSGGGGAVIVGEGETAPLVVNTVGTRNPEGKVVTESLFSRILRLDDVKAVMIGEKSYPLS